MADKRGPDLSAFEQIARGKDFLLTDEYAAAFRCAPQTARKNYCLSGACYGVVPIKRGNRLLWPVAQTRAVLSGAAI